MKILLLHLVTVSVIVELACALSLTKLNVNIKMFRKLSSHSLLRKIRRKYITGLSFLHENKNYFVERRLSTFKANSKNSSNSPEVDEF